MASHMYIVCLELCIGAAVVGHDYGATLSKSVMFYEARRSGKLPSNQRVNWRVDSGLRDGLANGVDLVGGYYDANDNVKFGLPMAFTVTILSWSVIEYGKKLASSGEIGYLMEATRWGSDYLLKAHPKPDVLYGEVGDDNSDHTTLKFTAVEPSISAPVIKTQDTAMLCGRRYLQIRLDRQTLYWSATWPKEVELLAKESLHNPYKVIIGSHDLKANHAIEKIVEIVSEHKKYTRKLCMDGWPTLSIHGDKIQAERDWVLSEFKAGKSPIMIAMNVVAWGLDLKDIKCVINYDFPGSMKDYVHRIGHTDRVGAKGTTYTYFTAANARFSRDLIKILEEAGQFISPNLAEMGRSTATSGGYGGLHD